MNRIISVGEQGEIVLPQDLIEKYDLEAGSQIVIEESEGLLILRPDTKFPIEIYPDERVEEFRQENEIKLEKFKLS